MESNEPHNEDEHDYIQLRPDATAPPGPDPPYPTEPPVPARRPVSPPAVQPKRPPTLYPRSSPPNTQHAPTTANVMAESTVPYAGANQPTHVQNVGAAYTPYPAAVPAPGPAPYPSPQYPPPPQYPPMSQYPPPSTAPPSYGQLQGYGQPPAAYPPQPGYEGPQYVGAPPSQQVQQSQQQVVVVSAGQPRPAVIHHVDSYVGHIIFACIVVWCCNWLFGLIAFILAMVASSTAVSNPTSARKLGHASIGMSVAGIVVTVIVVIVAVALVATAGSSYASSYSSSSSCSYRYGGTCYRYKTYVGYYGICSGVKSSSGYCYSGRVY